MKEYKIYYTLGIMKYFVLKVYPSVKTLHNGMERDGKTHDGAEGMFAPTKILLDSNGEAFAIDNIGTMYLWEGRLGADVVSHECLHVAMCIERFHNRFRMNYEIEDCNENEERLAYLLTDIVSAVYNVLYDNKHAKAEV